MTTPRVILHASDRKRAHYGDPVPTERRTPFNYCADCGNWYDAARRPWPDHSPECPLQDDNNAECDCRCRNCDRPLIGPGKAIGCDQCGAVLCSAVCAEEHAGASHPQPRTPARPRLAVAGFGLPTLASAGRIEDDAYGADCSECGAPAVRATSLQGNEFPACIHCDAELMLPDADEIGRATLERLNNAVDAAQAAFWAEIAKAYPEAKSGDLDPWMVHQFDQITRKAAGAWVEANAHD